MWRSKKTLRKIWGVKGSILKILREKNENTEGEIKKHWGSDKSLALCFWVFSTMFLRFEGLFVGVFAKNGRKAAIMEIFLSTLHF